VLTRPGSARDDLVEDGHRPIVVFNVLGRGEIARRSKEVGHALSHVVAGCLGLVVEGISVVGHGDTLPGHALLGVYFRNLPRKPSTHYVKVGAVETCQRGNTLDRVFGCLCRFDAPQPLLGESATRTTVLAPSGGQLTVRAADGLARWAGY